MLVDTGRNVKWIDGVRGIASFSVLLTHLTRAWDEALFKPASAENASPRLLQLPILRIPWQGRLGVITFAFLTGYVCALKPIRQARAGDAPAALVTIARSAFRRVPRLVLPAIIATLFAWVMAQAGMFTVATRSDSSWNRSASVNVDPSWRVETYRLVRQIINTWNNGHNDYDDHQWTLLPLLKGSMTVYTTLSATIFVKGQYRLLISGALYCYFWYCKEETFALQVMFGMFMCDLSQHTPAQEFISSRRWAQTMLPVGLFVIGLLLASYPNENPEWSGWSSAMQRWADLRLPYGADYPHYFSAAGLDLIAMGIYLSPKAKEILSSRYLLWLGRYSFAVYLIHGTLLRTVLTWMLYGISGQPWIETVNDAGEKVNPAWLPRRGPLAFCISIPVWICIVYGAAYLWTTYVDALCVRITQRVEHFIFEENEKSTGPALP
ncbi:MAG: hypothetical protein M1825_001201 [Sarcosagium campestre]|nr:MAG: hypothetical protein M1825_001201 [Sarcosagium campestre]